MTFTHRINLLAFSLFTWSTAMFVAADPNTIAPVSEIAVAQSGLGVALFIAALLPSPGVGFSR